MFRPRPAPLAIHFNGILLAIEPRSERRHTGYSIKVNIIVESFAHVGRLTYTVERDKASSQTGYAYQHSYLCLNLW